MKKIAKILGLVALLIAFAVPVAQAERVPMPVDKMPAQVQTFLNDYYPNAKVSKSWAKMMRPTTEPMWYRVNLDNGTKLWFNLQGEWYKVSAKKSNTPISIDLLPNDARKVISTEYQSGVKSISFKKDSYKVTLADGHKLKFAKTYGEVTKK